MARKLEVSRLMTTVVERNLVRHGIERIQGRARLLSPGKVEVDKGRRGSYRGERPAWCWSPAGHCLVVCRTSRWTTPMYTISWRTSWRLIQAPELLLVIGSGAAGCECASIIRRARHAGHHRGRHSLAPSSRYGDGRGARRVLQRHGDLRDPDGRRYPGSHGRAVRLEAKLTDGHTSARPEGPGGGWPVSADRGLGTLSKSA